MAHRRPSDLIPAKEAARLLGVKPATLYAYVSRGLIQAVEASGTRTKLYPRHDVERLKARALARSGHGALAAAALRWGEPVLDSSITRIDENGPHYRGFAATNLAATDVPFENVCELLWSGYLPNEPVRWQQDSTIYTSRYLIDSPLRTSRPHTFAIKLFSYLASVQGLATDDPEADLLHGFTRHVRGVISSYASHLFLLGRDNTKNDDGAPETLAETIAKALGVKTEHSKRLINMGCILSADHELTPSTFSARVAASTGADLFSCLGAASGALAGPRHGGTFDVLESMFAKAAETSPEAVLKQYRARGETPTGFAHDLYQSQDPRAALLVNELGPLNSKDRRVTLINEMIGTARRLGIGEPSIDTVLLLVAAALKLPPAGATAIFTIGRAAGWAAHILEQRMSGFTVRPRARYVGR